MRFVVQAIIAALLFGLATPISKSLLGSLSANHVAGLLYLGAAIFLAPVVLLRVRRGAQIYPPDSSNRRKLISAIAFGGIIGPILLLVGLQHAQATSVSMWLNLETVATAIFAAFLFREHLGVWAWVGNAGVVLAGVLLGYEGGWAGWIGLAYVAGAAISWGLDNNLTAGIDSISAEDTTFWKGLIAGVVNLAIGMTLHPTAFDQSWLIALAVGGFAYGISVALYIRSAQGMGASRSQMMFSAAPFFGVLLSAIWLGERMDLLQMISLAVLAVSIVLVFVGRHDHQHEHHPIDHEHEHRHDDLHHDHAHPELMAGKVHSHPHQHAATVHAHPHWPDLHHRHHG